MGKENPFSATPFDVMGVSPAQAKVFQVRLRGFGEMFQDYYKDYKEGLRWTSFPGEELFGLTSPEKLPGNGVESLFLVVWNSSATSTSGEAFKAEVRPLEFWLARGIGLRKVWNKEALEVDFCEIGILKPGSGKEIEPASDNSVNRGSIYLNSPVILRP